MAKIIIIIIIIIIITGTCPVSHTTGLFLRVKAIEA
jgi:hypothetical protein